LVGISAKRDIGMQEAYIYVPSKLIICEEKFRQDTVIGHIIDSHPDVFSEHSFAEHMVLIFFCMYEMGKGNEGFWHPFFETAEYCDMLNKWS
jgi:hypothetical protein